MKNLFLIGIILGGCEMHTHKDAGHMEEEIFTESCEHAADGPFVDVNAGGEGDAGTAAPDVSEHHKAYRITTVELDALGNRGGQLSYEASVAGHHTFFISHHFDMTFTGATGGPQGPKESVHEVNQCEELAMYHVAELEVGTYRVDFGPVSHEVITLVVETGSPKSHDHEAHEHPEE